MCSGPFLERSSSAGVEFLSLYALKLWSLEWTIELDSDAGHAGDAIRLLSNHISLLSLINLFKLTCDPLVLFFSIAKKNSVQKTGCY